MQVGDVLRKKAARVATVRMNETVAIAAQLMRSSNISALVVKDVVRTEGNTAVGMFTERDVVRAIAEHGAALTLNSRQLDAKALKAAVVAHAKAQGLRSTEWFIFECSGTAPGQLTAYGLLVHGATLSVVGFTMDKVEIRLSNLMAFDARALGNWGCPPESYPAALDLVLDGRVQIAPFVEMHALDEINPVFEAVHRREIRRRVVLTP